MEQPRTVVAILDGSDVGRRADPTAAMAEPRRRTTGEQLHLDARRPSHHPRARLPIVLPLASLAGRPQERSRLAGHQHPGWRGDTRRYPRAATTSCYTKDDSDYDVVEIPLGGGVVRSILESSRNETDPVWSLDGGLLAHVTNRSGQDEIWVRDAPVGWMTSRSSRSATSTRMTPRSCSTLPASLPTGSG